MLQANLSILTIDVFQSSPSHPIQLQRLIVSVAGVFCFAFAYGYM